MCDTERVGGGMGGFGGPKALVGVAEEAAATGV